MRTKFLIIAIPGVVSMLVACSGEAEIDPQEIGDHVPEMSADEYLRQSILDPSAYIVEDYDDNMEKGYKYGLSEEEVDDLVAFLLTQ